MKGRVCECEDRRGEDSLVDTQSHLSPCASCVDSLPEHTFLSTGCDHAHWLSWLARSSRSSCTRCSLGSLWLDIKSVKESVHLVSDAC